MFNYASEEWRSHDYLAIFAPSKMSALKSHRYVEIKNNNNGLVFRHKSFHIYSMLSFKFTCCMKFDIFKNSEVTDVLEWPPNDFYVMKNVCREKNKLRKIAWVWNDTNKASDSAFTVNVCCAFPGTHLQLLCKLINCLR